MEQWTNAKLADAVNGTVNALQVFAEAISAVLPQESTKLIESHLTTSASRMDAQGMTSSAFVCREIARAIHAPNSH